MTNAPLKTKIGTKSKAGVDKFNLRLDKTLAEKVKVASVLNGDSSKPWLHEDPEGSGIFVIEDTDPNLLA